MGALLVEPLYYGMLAFAELTANHSRWLTHTQSAAAPGFVAHATVNKGGDVKVLLIAKDLADAGEEARTVLVCLDAANPNQIGSVAKVFALTAPSVNSTVTDKVVYAGQTFLGSTDGQPKSIYWVSPRICSRTLMECSEGGGGGFGAPHQCFLGTASCDLVVMLTRAPLMTSSHSEGKPIGERAYVSIAGEVRNGQLCFSCQLPPLSAALVVVDAPPLSAAPGSQTG